LITFYDGDTGERLELSEISFNNWLAKTANMLVDEFDLQRRGHVFVDLPLHWAFPVWVRAIWAVGASVHLESDWPEFDVAVIGPSTFSELPNAQEIVACSLRPMAQSFPTPPPAGIVDYFADVRIHGDHFSGISEFPAGQAAIVLEDQAFPMDWLENQARQLATRLQLNDGGRILITDLDPPAAFDLALASVVAPRIMGTSVVLVTNSDPHAVQRIAEQERVTATLSRP